MLVRISMCFITFHIKVYAPMTQKMLFIIITSELIIFVVLLNTFKLPIFIFCSDQVSNHSVEALSEGLSAINGYNDTLIEEPATELNMQRDHLPNGKTYSMHKKSTKPILHI